MKGMYKYLFIVKFTYVISHNKHCVSADFDK